MSIKRPDLEIGLGHGREVLGLRSSTATPDIVSADQFTTPIQEQRLTGRWRDYRGNIWSSSFGFGPSDKRLLTGKTIATTPQQRGSNNTAMGARGSWESWGNTAGTTYATKAGNGPVVASNFITSYGNSLIDYHAGKGENFVRFLLEHEALQPDPSAPAIPYAGSFTNASRYAQYWTNYCKPLIDYLVLTKGCTVLLDFHNATTEMMTYFGRRFRVSPGAGEEDAAILVDVWTRLAALFPTSTYGGKIWFGIHNEPNQGDGSTIANLFPVIQNVITGIRSTGNTGKILVPGLDFTSSRYFVFNGSYAAFKALTDPANNLGIQVHLYFDSSNSGGGTQHTGSNPDYGITYAANTTSDPKDRLPDGSLATNVDVGPARLRHLTTRCREDGFKYWITEIAITTRDQADVDQTALATTVWRNTMDFVNANADVCGGWQHWQSNNIPGHAYSNDPSGGVDSPIMDVIENDYVASVPTPVIANPFTDPNSFSTIYSWMRPSNNTNASGLVNTIGDSSSIGTNTYAKPSGVTNGPTYNASSPNLNNQPTLYTAATANRRIEHRRGTALTAAPYSLCFAGFFSTNSATEFWGSNNGNYDNGAGLTRQTDTFLRARNKTTTSNVITASLATLAGKHVVWVTYDPTSGLSLVYVDDHENPVASGSIDTLGFQVWTWGSFGTAMDMEIGEAFMLSGTARPVAKERRNGMRYLGNLHAISTS